MPAPIVYQGVVAQDGGGGTLFKGLKFWVAHRIPNRSTCVNDIENNGGKVVPLERNADYLIADRARGDAPPGSYSFQFIKDALEDGSLDHADEYLIKSPAIQPRASTSTSTTTPATATATATASVHPKGTRTPFTKQDDQLLVEHVTRLERRGESISGNEIYKRFEAKYPHHTWHSWRDRWVKKLRHLPRPEVSDEEPPTAGPSTSRHGTPKASQEIPTSSKRIGAVRLRARFTEEEDELLWQYVREAAKNKRHLNGNKIYEELAYDFPQHSFHSWRDRALKVIIPEHRDEMERLTAKAQSNPPKRALDQFVVQENDPKPRDQLAAYRASQLRRAARTKLAALQATQRNASPVSQSTAETPVQAVAPRNHKEKQASHSHQKQPQHSPKINVQPQSNVQADQVYESTNPPYCSPSLPTESPTKLPKEEHLVPKRLEVGLKPQFYRDYSSFLENEDVQVIPWPSIRGRAIELWDLWRAVISQKVDPSERDWQQVAEVLGFNWIEDETAPEEIRLCYENNLASFEEAMLSFQEFEDDDDDEEEEEEAEGEGNPGEVEDDTEEIEEPMPSSPPVRPSLKRPFAATNPSSDPTYPHSSPKRRRLDRNREVPSTPDDVNGTSRLRHHPYIDATPTRQTNTPRVGSSASRDQMQLFATNEDEENELRDELQELPALPHPRHRGLEPETQDFQFDPDTQRFVLEEVREDVDEETRDNITPSQQLRQESDAASPGELENTRSPQWQAKEATQDTTPTSRRRIRNPFIQDESGDATPRAIRARGNNRLLASSSPAAQQRRSLPKAWVQDKPTEVHPSMPPTSQPTQQRQQKPATPPVPSRKRKSPPRSAEAHARDRTATPVKETPDDIIDRFLALGYTRAIVVRALRATTWHIGNAGQVMEILRRGEELPQRTSGVWTQRDDDALMLVDSEAPPRDAREEKKRAKELRRLEAKHGVQGMETRRRYLNA
ncbi:TRF2-interacting telomeric protein/Rap1 C terminal domain-containing protein [Biscogniauxia marginata]|nr:TRF2-interacting telomeric protein/Rap1 C terminal domain-containing protein [Biscogniauxia marginata]